MPRTIFAATVCASVLTAPGLAQDGGFGFALIGQQAVDFSFNTMNTVIGNNALDAVTQPRQGAGARGPAVAGRLALTAPGGGAGMAGAVSLPYQPSSTLAREALDGYLARLKSNNPKLAPIAADQFGRHDYRQVYRGLTRGTGLSEHDLVDIMAAWTMLGWMVANNHLDNPDLGQLRALRAQLAGALASNPRLADSRTRALLGEEMKIHFVTLHAGWQGAQREGRLPQYADAVAQLFRRTGTDLRQLAMTGQGLVQR